MIHRLVGRWWRNRSVLDRFAIPFALVMGAISLFVYLYFPSALQRREVEALSARAQSVADVTAAALAPAVLFEDRAQLRVFMGLAFEGGDDVVHARLTDPAGEELDQVTANFFEPHADREGPAPAFTTARADVVAPDGTVIAHLSISLSQKRVEENVAAIRATVKVVAAVLFLLGVVALFLVSRLVTGPLFQIVEVAERIGRGDPAARAPVLNNDEVGRLAGAFNGMVDELQKSQGALEAVNLDLEQRVEERTRHLREEQAQRMRAEAEKARLEQFYGQILDALPLEIGVLDLDGRFVYLNPSAVEIPEKRAMYLGKTAEEAGFAERAGADVQARRDEALKRAMETACLVSIEESYTTDADGTRHFIRVFSPMVTALGEVAKIVSYGVDVTNRKEAEEALRESEEKLRQSQKMEAVGRLAGGIAHDFNNLLTVISGHAELLMMGMSEGSPDFEEVDQVKRAADQAATLTRQLLAFSRRQVLQPRLLDVNEVVSGVERMLGRLIGEHIQLVTDLRFGLGQVEADPGQLEQVLMNLAVNARDAMPEGGRLTIETESVGSLEAMSRWGYHLTADHFTMVCVRDTGVGIDEEHLGQIFEPFFTTKEVGAGTGLGLATVYGIVKQSGGYIFVDSRKGHGTTFRVFLPVVATGERGDLERGLGLASELAKGSETVLLVEDEAMVRNLTTRILQRAGYRVLAASGPHEALGIVNNHPGPIHLLFTDVIMPGMQGNELAAKVVELRPSVKVLYMSGYTDDALLKQGVLGEGVVLLQKPFTMDRAARVVRSVLDRGNKVDLPLQYVRGD